MVSQDRIDDIRIRTSIVDVISEYVMLRRRGANYVGLCPFHSERTPSFTVSEEKKIFYCFGCNAKGNVFTFLMKYENLSFIEAVKILAAKAGVDVRDSGDRRYKRDYREEIIEIINHAAEYFHGLLLGGGEEAKNYLKQRGVDIGIIEEFRLGYAGSSWDGLARFFSSKGISLDKAVEAGLLIRRKGGGYYDRFRERLIFPILDTQGRVIAFGGRGLKQRIEPKYLNSPESTLFKKGETLYGLYQAKGHIKRKGFVLIVEGYFDLITLYHHGFKNVVATMGTAITAWHLRKLKGYANEVYTLFDSDEAGKKAAIKTISISMAEGMPARGVFIPGGMDPDEFVAREGDDAMRKAIGKAMPLMDFFLKELRDRHDLSSASGKKAFMADVLPYLKKISDVTERGHYAEIVSNILGIGVDIVYTAMKCVKRAKQRTLMPPYDLISIQDNLRAEEQIIRILIFYPELYKGTVEDAIGKFKDKHLKDVAIYVVDNIKRNAVLDVSSAQDADLDEKTKEWFVRMAIGGRDDIKDAPGRILDDCCRKVLSASKIREETLRLLKRLEDAGLQKEADLIKRGAESYQLRR